MALSARASHADAATATGRRIIMLGAYCDGRPVEMRDAVNAGSMQPAPCSHPIRVVRSRGANTDPDRHLVASRVVHGVQRPGDGVAQRRASVAARPDDTAVGRVVSVGAGDAGGD